MSTSTARIETQSASRYLQQLCKHWSHKFAVDFTPEAGTITFDEGRAARLAASPNALDVTIEAADSSVLERMEGVVFDHIKRFAFREELADPTWTRAS